MEYNIGIAKISIVIFFQIEFEKENGLHLDCSSVFTSLV